MRYINHTRPIQNMIVMSALIAHPVAAILFTRFGLCLSALIIGSMSPDFLYFFMLPVQLLLISLGEQMKSI